MRIVKVISTKLDDKTRRLVKYLGLGKKDVQESLQVAPFGTDSNPLKDSVAVYAPTLQNGKPKILGYININQISEPGEHRIFSTDGNGNVVMALHLKNDGTAEFGGDVDNLMRFTNTKAVTDELKADINNLKSILAGWTPVPNDGGAALKAALGGYPANPIAQSIDPSKIDEIKTS